MFKDAIYYKYKCETMCWLLIVPKLVYQKSRYCVNSQTEMEYDSMLDL